MCLYRALQGTCACFQAQHPCQRSKGWYASLLRPFRCSACSSQACPLAQEAADWNSPAVNLQPEIQTLNLGLSLVGFGHLMVLLPLWDFPEAGPWLHTVATFWGCVGSIGLLGALPPYGPKVASTS